LSLAHPARRERARCPHPLAELAAQKQSHPRLEAEEAWPPGLISYTLHRHRRELFPQHPCKGTSCRAWSFNVQFLPQGYLQESLEIAAKHSIQVVFLQDTRWGDSGPRCIGEYQLFYANRTTGTSADGLVTAVHCEWPCKRANITHREIIPGRCLAVRVRTAQHDLTLINCYAPQNPKTAAERQNQTFWDQFQGCLSALPTRTAALIGGDFNAHVGELHDPQHVGRCGAEKDNYNGSSLRELTHATNMFLPLTFLKGKRSSWTWVSSDESCTRRIDHWILP
jgi:exonuclease III